MNRLFLMTMMGALLLGADAFGQTATVKLAWDPSPTVDVEGYRVYARDAGSVDWEDAVAEVPVGQLTEHSPGNVGTAIQLPAGNWEIMVTAYRGVLESRPSNVVTHSPLFPPGSLRITSVTVEITSGSPGGSGGSNP